ncbi:hypothetical protein JCM19047_714 [Bacillus sp. JCM 19047]|nr:hypothetical protein JCM19047_714 [Bacillus sp. JCM 19047]
MNKLEFLYETSRGQSQLYMDRRRREISVQIPLEPKSKSSIKINQKVVFQHAIEKVLKDTNRRGYLGPIAVEFDFYPTENNPPHIHQLPKNYLDLLSKPIKESNIKRKNLLFQDDRQVEMLIANYHIEKRNDNPSISIKVNSMNTLLEDLKLLDKIRDNSFKCDEQKNNYDFEELLNEEHNMGNLQLELDDAIEKYNSTIQMEDYYIKHNSKEVFDEMLKMNLHSIQSIFLSLDKIRPYDLFYLFPNLFLKKFKISYKEVNNLNIFDSNRNLFLSPIISPLDILGLPTKKGETKLFKEKITQILRLFKNRFKFLSPLLVNLSLTILYVPPKYQVIDLDNLARYIVPFVNEELKPSSKLFYAQEDIKGFTHSSITQYQVIRIPRRNNDPDEGIVRFILSNKEPFSNFLQDTRSIISEWNRHIE